MEGKVEQKIYGLSLKQATTHLVRLVGSGSFLKGNTVILLVLENKKFVDGELIEKVAA